MITDTKRSVRSQHTFANLRRVRSQNKSVAAAPRPERSHKRSWTELGSVVLALGCCFLNT